MAPRVAIPAIRTNTTRPARTMSTAARRAARVARMATSKPATTQHDKGPVRVLCLFGACWTATDRTFLSESGEDGWVRLPKTVCNRKSPRIMPRLAVGANGANRRYARASNQSMTLLSHVRGHLPGYRRFTKRERAPAPQKIGLPPATSAFARWVSVTRGVRGTANRLDAKRVCGYPGIREG